MQTFLPYPGFAQSAQCLDRQRLGKQRVEVKQILNALQNGGGWVNHPAVRMWRGYESTLIVYGMDVCFEWIRRGYRDTLLYYFCSKLREFDSSLFPHPPWLGDESFHASHRSNLLRKDPGHYGQFGWTERPELPYVWPV